MLEAPTAEAVRETKELADAIRRAVTAMGEKAIIDNPPPIAEKIRQLYGDQFVRYAKAA